MDFRNPEIYPYFKDVENDVNKLPCDELLSTLAKCEEMLGMEIPDKYIDIAHAYRYFIEERLHNVKDK